MNKKVFTLSIIDNKLPLFICFCFLAGTIMSFYLSISISDYFYFLSVPILLLTLYLIKLTIGQVKNEYKRLIKKEKYLKDGCHLRYFDNNKKQVKFEINIISGKRDGAFIEYYLDGQVKVNANYNIGEFNGPHKTYYENGKKSKDCNYEKGELHGEYKEYHENGNLKLQTQYKKGTQTGETKSFYDNGNKSIETNYNNDKQNGLTISYYKNGMKAREFEMRNGIIYGEVIEYNKDGTLKFKNKGINYLFFNSEGQKACSINIDKHAAVGTWQNFRSDGTLQYELEFDKASTEDATKGALTKKKLVKKAIYTINGDVFSTTKLSYNIIHESCYKFLSKYADNRVTSKEEIIIRGIIMQGPGGVSGLANNTYIKNTPIKSIKDIIELNPIKGFENE